jgi:hypothetical protein
MAEMTKDPVLLEAIRRAVMGPQSGPITLVATPTNVTDLRTRKPYYPPGSLARSLQNDEAFAPKDGR